jgi:hypothetical protein
LRGKIVYRHRNTKYTKVTKNAKGEGARTYVLDWVKDNMEGVYEQAKGVDCKGIDNRAKPDCLREAAHLGDTCSIAWEKLRISMTS